MSTLRLHLMRSARPASGIGASDYVDVLRATLRIVHDVEINTNPAKKRWFDWEVLDLDTSRSIDTVLRVVPQNGAPPDAPEQVLRHAVDGLRLLEAEDSIPHYFGDESLLGVERLGQALRRHDLALDATGFLEPTSDEVAEAHVSQRAGANAKRTRKARAVSIGSLVGLLHAVDIGHTRRPAAVSVFDERWRRSIKCRMDRQQLTGIEREWLGHRVHVAGKIHRNRRGQPVWVELRSLDVLHGDHEDPLELRGIAPDITDGRDSVEYVREARDG